MTTTVTIPYGRRTFEVELTLSERRTLSLTVHPDLRITAKAPVDQDLQWIQKRMEKRARWIARNVDHFEQFQPLPTARRYVSGETHYYLGRQYRLRIRPGERARVRLMGQYFEMELPDPGDAERAKRALQDWYRDHAKTLLTRRVEERWPVVFERLGAPEPSLRFRRMQKRWGSCSRNGTILLNTELVKSPSDCIDYVVVHELCHLLHPNHDRTFYRLLTRVMPDWENRRDRLAIALAV